MIYYVARQLGKAIDKLREEIRESSRQQIGAIRESTEAICENKQSPLSTPLPVQIEVPQVDKDEQLSQFSRSLRVQKWLCVGTWLAFIAAGIYAGIAARQLGEMKRTNELTQQSLNSSSDSLNATLLKMQAQIDQMSRLADNAGRQATQTTNLVNATHALAIAAGKQADEAKQSAITTEKTYEASLRPYVGVESDHTEIDSNKSTIVQTFTLKNSGQVPADTLTSHVKVLSNGAESISIGERTDAHNGLNPGDRMVVPEGVIDGIAYSAIHGTSKLMILLKWTYTWRDKTETDCTEVQYDPAIQKFGIIGADCAVWNTK